MGNEKRKRTAANDFALSALVVVGCLVETSRANSVTCTSEVPALTVAPIRDTYQEGTASHTFTTEGECVCIDASSSTSNYRTGDSTWWTFDLNFAVTEPISYTLTFTPNTDTTNGFDVPNTGNTASNPCTNGGGDQLIAYDTVASSTPAPANGLLQVKERKFCRNDASTRDNDPALGTSYTMNIDTASSPGTIDNPRGAIRLRTLSGTPVGTFIGKVCYP